MTPLPCRQCQFPATDPSRLCDPCLNQLLWLLARSIPRALAAKAEAITRKAA